MYLNLLRFLNNIMLFQISSHQTIKAYCNLHRLHRIQASLYFSIQILHEILRRIYNIQKKFKLTHDEDPHSVK